MARVRRLLATALLALACAASAQECTWEQEPNDKPAMATVLSGLGPDSALPPSGRRLPILCLAGEMSGNDQDAFWWEVDERGADQRWVIDLEGIAGHLTSLDLIRLAFADNQTDVERRDDLLNVSTRNGSLVTSPGFIVEPGRYLIALAKSGGAGQYVAHLRPIESLGNSSRPASGRALTGGINVHGAAPDGYTQPWVIGEEEARFAWGVTLEAALGSGSELVVTGPGGAVMGRAKVDATGNASLGSLGLAPGNYEVRVSGAPVFRLRAAAQGRRGDGVALEPNDTFEQATRFDPGTTMRGSLGGRDYFRITVDEAAAALTWDLGLEATAELDVWLSREDGTELMQRRRAREGVTGLKLAEGAYQLLLYGDAGTAYTLTLSQGAATAAGAEVEPNDTPANPTKLGKDGQVRGVLSHYDTDVFAFEVEGEAQLYRLQLISQGSAELAVLDGGGGVSASTSGEQRLRLDNVLLLAGTHLIRVEGDEGEYALRILPLGPPPPAPTLADMPDPDEPLTAAPSTPERQTADQAAAAPAQAELPQLPPPPPGQLELEPNDDVTRAGRLFPGIPWVGTLPDERDSDYYRFHLAADQAVRIELVPPANSMPIEFLLDRTWVRAADDAGPGTPTVVEAWLLAGDHYLELRGATTGNGYYQLRLTQLNTAMPLGEERKDTGISVSLASETAELAAYWSEGQTVTATARVTNEGSEPKDVVLNAATTDARVGVALERSLRLAPGASAEVPVTVNIPADLRDDLPLRISLAATTGAGSTGASLAFAARCEAAPVAPTTYWPVPEALLGGIDVLWSSLGAKPHGTSIRPSRDAALIDGRVSPATGGATSPEQATVFQLAGAEPLKVVGALLHPLADVEEPMQLKRFRLETSLDGATFTTAYEGDLLAARFEQAFVFEQPVLARYARIFGLTDQRGNKATGNYLGELKLIAEDRAALGAFDIADPELGGHVVWSSPNAGPYLLASGGRPDQVAVRGIDAFSFVLGFHNARAAQVTGLEWADDPEAIAEGHVFKSVLIDASMTGAAGPWSRVAEWELKRDASGRARLELSAPAWARYLRFTAAKADPGHDYVAEPADVVVREREADGEYLSILGQWGLGSPLGVYEYLQPSPASADIEADADNDTLQTATPLTNGASVEGTVAVAEDVDWYRVRIEGGHNHLALRLTGEPTIEFEYELVDPDGNPAAYDLREEGDAVVLTLYGEPGDYYLRIEEPKRTVVFSWDTSGSMGGFLPITYNALATFAAGMDGERESVQLLAYDDPTPKWLLPIWTDDTGRVQRTVNEFDRDADSSNSEQALLLATRALAQRDGTRALMLITDAETSGHHLNEKMWGALATAQPRIFTFEVSSGGSLYSQQLMQDWAAVNGGHYTLAATIGDLEAGYSRASCLLRRPKHYRIEVKSSSEALPGPGSVSVSRPAGAPTPAVEVIFDASGSMGAVLPSGEQRIVAAKRVLESLVSEVMPEGTPFALRAFGHVKPMTCDTRLDVPFGPLDRAKALAAVRAIEPKLLSGTPLAESLAQVADDLAKAGRERTVILITDGAESCGGDPIAAVRELRRNTPVDLAIVSLGLEAGERQAFEALAAATNASYVDVTSFEELRASIDAALNPPFEVIGGDGTVVATGLLDGGPVAVEMGVYTVRVHGTTPHEFVGVRVPGEKSVALTYSGK